VGTVLDPEFVLTLITAGLLALVSYLDDRHGLPVAVRLVAHVAAATLLIELLQVQLPIALPLALVAVWATNLFNFMDGADGLAGGMATIGFSAMGLASANVAPDLGIVCFVLAAAAAGFLTFNFPPAKIFMGDAGSVPMGFLTAALGLVGWTRNAWPLSFIPLVFFPFVADSTVTLVKRFIAGREVWHPHREHFYQRLVGLGCSHRKLVGLYYMMMITCGGAALLSLTLSDVGKGIIWGGCCLITGFAMHRMDTRWKSFESGV